MLLRPNEGGRMNHHASELRRQGWAKIPKEERGRYVGHQGGRPRLYPPCPKNKQGSHRWKNGVCKCGQVQIVAPN